MTTHGTLAVAFEGEDQVRVGGQSAAGSSRLPEPDMHEALRLLQRLNRWTLDDGTRVSGVVRVDGFEPWWFAQHHLLWRILGPATRYCEPLRHWIAQEPLELRDPPDELRALVRSLRRTEDAVEPRMVRSAAGPAGSGRRRRRKRARRATSRRLAAHSLLSLARFAGRRPPALLYTVDRVTPGLGCDFRLRPIYQELERRGDAFAEYVHVGQQDGGAGDLSARARPAVYFERLDWLGTATPRPQGAPSTGDGSFEDLLLSRVAARGLELAIANARRYRVLKSLLRLHRPRYALVMDDSRHTHALVAACKELGIPVIGFQHAVGFNRFYAGLACYGWSGARSHAPDRYALWSQYFRDRLLGFSELHTADDTFVCGNLRPPPLHALAPPDRRAAGGRLRVLLVSEPKASPDELLPVVERLVKHEGFEVRLKVRPGEDLDLARKLFGSLFDAMAVVETPSVHDAFADCDVVMGLYSSVLYEALQAPKPVVVLKTRSSWAGDLGAEGLATVVDETGSACERIAQAAALPVDELARRRDVVWGKEPGEGAQRLFQVVDRQVAAGGA